ncbi:MAG: FAD binding domain-containing protein [Candidatus Krumholzibacteriia bacterium]
MRHLREYLWPESTNGALEMLRMRPGRGAFLAGGTALVLQGDPQLDYVVDISRLGLDGIRTDARGLHLGATLTLERLLASREARARADGILAQAVERTRSSPWRRQATLAGRLLEGDPNDLVLPALLVQEADARVLRASGAQPQTLALEAALSACRGEPVLVLEIGLGARPGWRFALESLSRTALDAPMAAVVVGVGVHDGTVGEARIATCGLGPARAPGAERAVVGLRLDTGTFAGPQEAVSADIQPASDHRCSREYREHLARVLLGRALRRALSRGSSEGGDGATPS